MSSLCKTLPLVASRSVHLVCHFFIHRWVGQMDGDVARIGQGFVKRKKNSPMPSSAYDPANLTTPCLYDNLARILVLFCSKRDAKSNQVNAQTCFCIGSLTKAFTAAIWAQILQDEKG